MLEDVLYKSLIQENATLKAQRDELLEAAEIALEAMKNYASYRRSEGLTAGSVFLSSGIEHVEKAIQNCK